MQSSKVSHPQHLLVEVFTTKGQIDTNKPSVRYTVHYTGQTCDEQVNTTERHRVAKKLPYLLVRVTDPRANPDAMGKR